MQNYVYIHFIIYFVCLQKLVSSPQGKPFEVAIEQIAGENIYTYERGTKRKLEETA
jgi:hypothetical protein